MMVRMLGSGIVLFLLLGISFSAKGQCTDMNSVYMKKLLGDAVYDNFRRTEISYSKDPYDIEFQVDLLKSFNYKLVFDMTGKSEGVIVKLYDLGKKKTNAQPILLYTSTEDKMDENATFQISFKAPKTRLLVKYEVKDATYTGCVTFVLGVFLIDKKVKETNQETNN